MSFQMKTSKLRIDPHRVLPDLSKDNYGSKDGIILWRIWVDELLIAENAYPFTKTDSSIDMSIDPNFPFWGDSNYYIHVRRLGKYILWLDFDNRHAYRAYTSYFYVFDAEEYASVCDTGLEQTEDKEVLRVLGRPHVSYQGMEDKEIKQVFQTFFPRHLDEVVIYRQPADRYDTTGQLITRRIAKALAETNHFKVCDVPGKTIELRVGLDMPEFVEAIWHVGRCNDGFAIYFEESPYFPAWLYSEKLSKALEPEEFTKEL